MKEQKIKGAGGYEDSGDTIGKFEYAYTAAPGEYVGVNAWVMRTSEDGPGSTPETLICTNYAGQLIATARTVGDNEWVMFNEYDAMGGYQR